MSGKTMEWQQQKVGFFPAFFNLAETSRLVRIAERYRELGGEAIFFSHGGDYERLAKEAGFSVQPVEPIYTEEQIQDLMKYDRGEKKGDPFSDAWLNDHIHNEEREYGNHAVSHVVTGFNLPCVLSVRKARIPLVYIIPGSILPAYFKAGFATFPEEFENTFTRLLPDRLKNWIANWAWLHLKQSIGAFNRVAKRNGLQRLSGTLDLWTGDYTLVSDLKEALSIPAKYDFPEKNYIGPLLANLEIPLEDEIKNHLNRPGPKIYFAMGSSGNKELYLRILSTLARTNYNVIAAYTNILNEDELPSVEDNILIKKHIPAEAVNKRVDLAILHGGQGTIYTAAYSGKPMVGIPMQFEQQYNIDILVRNGSAIRISKRFFSEKELLNAIESVLNNYSKYKMKASELASRLPVVDGAQKGAERIKSIVKESI